MLLTLSTYSKTRYSLPFFLNASRRSTIFSCFSVRNIRSSRKVVRLTSSFSAKRAAMNISIIKELIRMYRGHSWTFTADESFAKEQARTDPMTVYPYTGTFPNHLNC